MQHDNIEFIGKILMPFSQGSVAFSLPGDYTPASRVVKTTFMKNNAEQPKDELSAVSLAHHLLESISIPRGISYTRKKS